MGWDEGMAGVQVPTQRRPRPLPHHPGLTAAGLQDAPRSSHTPGLLVTLPVATPT